MLRTSTDTAQLAEPAWCCADVFTHDGRTCVPHPQRGLPVEYDDLQQRR